MPPGTTHLRFLDVNVLVARKRGQKDIGSCAQVDNDATRHDTGEFALTVDLL